MKTVVIGSGAVGLTIAFRLAQQGIEVCVVEKGRLGKKSSWAGAGILPPANDKDPVHAIDHLQALSNRLHPQLSSELLELTGIDNEFVKCGGINLATTIGESAALIGMTHLWQKQKVSFNELTNEELYCAEPNLNQDSLDVRKAIRVPSESQLRNPRHLKALIAACQLLGVQFLENKEVYKLDVKKNSTTVILKNESIQSDVVCVAAGAWSSRLLSGLSSLQVIPIKGHMLLFKIDRPLFRNVINEGNRYVVSRKDGHVLVGSSEEETGYNESTSSEEVNRLKKFASSLSSLLVDGNLVDVWTGLRPMAYDHLPYIGRHSEYPNVFVATGHFRSGLHLSPATADVICNCILGKQLDFDISALRPER